MGRLANNSRVRFERARGEDKRNHVHCFWLDAHDNEPIYDLWCCERLTEVDRWDPWTWSKESQIAHAYELHHSDIDDRTHWGDCPCSECVPFWYLLDEPDDQDYYDPVINPAYAHEEMERELDEFQNYFEIEWDDDLECELAVNEDEENFNILMGETTDETLERLFQEGIAA